MQFSLDTVSVGVSMGQRTVSIDYKALGLIDRPMQMYRIIHRYKLVSETR